MFRYNFRVFARFSCEKKIRHLSKMFYAAEKATDSTRFSTLSRDLATALDYYRRCAAPDDPFVKLFENYHPDLSRSAFSEIIGRFERLADLDGRETYFRVREEDGSPVKKSAPVRVMMHNFRSAFNTGAVMRSAEYFGFEQIIFCGHTPGPENKKVRQAAMGAAEKIDWLKENDLRQPIYDLQRQGYDIVALETAEHAESLGDIAFDFPLALVLGNEKYGLSEEILKKADRIVNIPAYGWKNSLNVSNAFAAAAFEVRRQYEKKND